jgi:hypothetical protein
MSAAETVHPGHVIEVREEGYGLMHPIQCRPHLLDCPVQKACAAMWEPPAVPGRYTISLTLGGEVVIGDLTEEEPDGWREVVESDPLEQLVDCVHEGCRRGQVIKHYPESCVAMCPRCLGNGSTAVDVVRFYRSKLASALLDAGRSQLIVDYDAEASAIARGEVHYG